MLNSEENFAANLRARRDEIGMSQEELAREMTERGFGFHQATVYKIETGARRVRLAEADALADALGTNVGRLTWPPEQNRHAAAVEQSADRLLYAYNEIGAATRRLLAERDRLRRALARLRESDSDGAWGEWLAQSEAVLASEPETAVANARSACTEEHGNGKRQETP